MSSHCPMLERCPFFHDRMENMPSIAELMKKQYCRGDNSQCGRYLIASELGPGHMPPDLFPNELERARAILAEHAA